tara:strand:+ start:2614 stop:3198 length:585 start_codon:yes stop_codon:yes gene_type:complete
MITTHNISDKPLQLAMDYAIKKIYSGTILMPIYIDFSNKLIHSHGLHGRVNINDYNRIPSSINEESRGVIRDKYDGWFHYITLSNKFYNINKKRILKMGSYWEYNLIYGETNTKYYSRLCWLTTVLTHELSHACQFDINDIGVTKYSTICLDKNISKNWCKDIYEFDAEKQASVVRVEFLNFMKESIKGQVHGR